MPALRYLSDVLIVLGILLVCILVGFGWAIVAGAAWLATFFISTVLGRKNRKRLVIAALLLGATRLHAHDMDPSHDEWYRTLKMPDNPTVSCCGEADAYWCDVVRSRKGVTTCTITDDRDDLPLNRPHVPVGTEVVIPDYKLKWDRGNPTGHAIVFMSQSGTVYCFVQGTGI